jgi:hypothetical protein
MTAVTPTVGRVVHYRPLDSEAPITALVVKGKPTVMVKHDQPFAAIVTCVNDDSVNLAVFHANGDSFGKQNVTLVQDDVEPVAGQCHWYTNDLWRAAEIAAAKAEAEAAAKAAADAKAAAEAAKIQAAAAVAPSVQPATPVAPAPTPPAAA